MKLIGANTFNSYQKAEIYKQMGVNFFKMRQHFIYLGKYINILFNISNYA